MKSRHDEGISLGDAVKAAISLRGKHLEGTKLGKRCIKVAEEFEKDGSAARKNAERILDAFPIEVAVPTGAVFLKTFTELVSDKEFDKDTERAVVVAMSVALAFMYELAEDMDESGEDGKKADVYDEDEEEEEEEEEEDGDIRLSRFSCGLPSAMDPKEVEKAVAAFVEYAKKRLRASANDADDFYFSVNTEISRNRGDERICVDIDVRTQADQIDRDVFDRLMQDLKKTFTKNLTALGCAKTAYDDADMVTFEGVSDEFPGAEKLTEAVEIVKRLFGDDAFRHISAESVEKGDRYIVRVNAAFTEKAKNDRIFPLKKRIAEKLVSLYAK